MTFARNIFIWELGIQVGVLIIQEKEDPADFAASLTTVGCNPEFAERQRQKYISSLGALPLGHIGMSPGELWVLAFVEDNKVQMSLLIDDAARNVAVMYCLLNDKPQLQEIMIELTSTYITAAFQEYALLANPAPREVAPILISALLAGTAGYIALKYLL